MGHHPNGNGQSGAHYFREGAQPWAPPASPSSSATSAVSDLAKGYVPIRWVIAIIGAVAVAAVTGAGAAFSVGRVWENQQNTIVTLQKDVDKLGTVQELHGAKIGEIKAVVDKTQTTAEQTQAVLKQFTDNPPWYVSVKAAR
jgi:hypothetical protein